MRAPLPLRRTFPAGPPVDPAADAGTDDDAEGDLAGPRERRIRRAGPVRWTRSYLEAPPGSTPLERHNFHFAYREAALIGVINAGGVFMPVFVARLGGSNLQVSMVAMLPALAGVLLALPLGWFMQTRTNVIPWYSIGRIGSQAAYGLAALASLLMPASMVIPAVLAIYGVAMVFGTATNVSFNVVMNATAGTRGRFELMSRRWSLMGLLTALTLAVAGVSLDIIAFPLNYQLVFVAFSLTGLWAYRYGSRIIVPDHPPDARGSGGDPLLARARVIAGRVRRERAFLSFEARRFVAAVGTSLALPLVPLYYVRVLDASDAWIGLIGTAQSLMLLVGYALWRHQSRVRGASFVMTAALFGVAVYPLALSLTHAPEVAILVIGGGAIFSAGLNLAVFDRLMSTVPDGFGVTFNSIDTTLVNFAGTLSPLAAAVLAGLVGIEGALVVASGVGLVAAILFALDRTGPRIGTVDLVDEPVAA